MLATTSVALLLVALTSIHEIGGLPLTPDSPLWHKITKRDTPAVAPSTAEEKKNNSSQTSANENGLKKTSTGNGDELIETQPDSLAPEPSPYASTDAEQSSHNSEKDENDSSSERSIDWQLLSGNPADLERELESRRRRRSVRSSSLSRQHRIRTAGRVQRSRSKRNAYYDVNPSDILAAYEYLQSRGQDQDQVEDDDETEESILGDVTDSDLANLASLIYELQRADDGGEDDDDQQVLPGGYEDFEQTNDYEPEVRITPEQLAALEQALSDQQAGDDEEDTVFYPKDKRSIDDDNGDDQDEDEDEAPEPTYLIPAALEPSSGYVQIPLASAYENPYDFYQIDDDPSLYEEAVRRFDEEQLRQRIASLIEDINEQRQIARRRRRR